MGIGAAGFVEGTRNAERLMEIEFLKERLMQASTISAHNCF